MVKKLKNKKGTEKPIEIFVALFVVLAVAMVLLKMFSGQVAEKSNELGQFSERQAAMGKCEELCSAAKTNNCREEELIKYCNAKFKLDLDGNSKIGINSEYPYELCEDSIFCPLVNECTCGQKLDIKECKQIMLRYYVNEFGKTEFQANETIKQKFNYSQGACIETNDAWTKLYGIN